MGGYTFFRFEKGRCIGIYRTPTSLDPPLTTSKNKLFFTEVNNYPKWFIFALQYHNNVIEAVEEKKSNIKPLRTQPRV